MRLIENLTIKHNFLESPIKRRNFTLILGFFWPDINSKKFKNNIFRLNSTRAIDWCINCHIWMIKNFSTIFTIGKGGPLPKKKSKIFSHPHMTIYTPIDSPC